MYVLTGRSCAGKNAVAEELIKRGHRRCITYTTRPMRNGEENGVDYHFVTDEKFAELKEENFFAEYISYNTVNGIWWYGTAANEFEDDDDKKFIILTPEGVRQVELVTGSRPKTIYIFANRKTIKERLKNRGDDPNEALRRIEQDEQDFKGFEMVADKIFYNNLDSNIDEIADKIETYLMKSTSAGGQNV